MKIKHKIFLIGAPRSGTTLIQQVLSAHPQLASFPETHYFQFLLRNDIRRYLDDFWIPKIRHKRFLSFVKEHKILEVPEHLKRPKNTQEAVSYFMELMSYNTLHSDKTGWIEKTPAHVFYIDRIERSHQDSSFIHIIRQPRRVLSSLVTVGRKYPDKWPRYANIHYSIETIESTLHNTLRYVESDNHTCVDFDNFLSSTNEALVELLDFCGLGQDSASIDDMVGSYHTNALSRTDEKWKSGYGASIDKNRTSKYETLFNDDEKSFIDMNINSSETMYGQLLQRSKGHSKRSD